MILVLEMIKQFLSSEALEQLRHDSQNLPQAVQVPVELPSEEPGHLGEALARLVVGDVCQVIDELDAFVAHERHPLHDADHLLPIAHYEAEQLRELEPVLFPSRALELGVCEPHAIIGRRLLSDGPGIVVGLRKKNRGQRQPWFMS